MAYTSPRGSPNLETGTSGWNDFDVLTLVILRYVNVAYVGRYASSSKHIKYMQLETIRTKILKVFCFERG